MTATLALPELIFIFMQSGYSEFGYDTFEQACIKAGSKHNMMWYLNRNYIQKVSNNNAKPTYSLSQTTIEKVVKCIDNVYTNEVHLSDVYITIRVPKKLRDDFGAAAASYGLNKSEYLRFLMIQGIDRKTEGLYTNNTKINSVANHV